MDKIRVVGGNPLQGKIRISGAKNATLPLLAACLLSDKPLTLTNVPKLSDVGTFLGLLEHLGVKVTNGQVGEGVTLDGANLTSCEAPYELVRKMRASVLVLGPLLARQRTARLSLPGGCAIGTRPIDLHLKGLEAMGATIHLEEGYVVAEAPQGLTGADFTFPIVSVTGTENLLMAACLAKGTTILRGAAQEPEVVDLAHCLQAMGASIQGIGTSTLTIEGPTAFKAASHRVLPDRIETGTYAMAVGMVGGSVDLVGTSLDLLPGVIPLLEKVGLTFTEIEDGFNVSFEKESLRPLDVGTEPFPGFPTDLQAQFMALMCLAAGESEIQENIFENRFMHVPELARMGANIAIKGNTAHVMGVDTLIGAPVMATDLRASVCLVLAGLAAQGETIISRVYHLDRGYEEIENKLGACGAHIERLKGEDNHECQAGSKPALKIASSRP
ncbi:MAG: UDP-N-acetylglucosamine 1-carboxyvinyltransferase [Alphaproteobacteria bacterium]|nr:UDP-N-acetylglucosamine 1-carboxyvinyltransferase [Alphaproteobacteria bacterium]